MNYKFAAATLVLAGALGAAGCSHNNQQEGPASNASQTPPYSAATAARPAGTAPAAGTTSGAAGTNNMGAMSSAGGPKASFNDLAGSKGYITQQDAQRDAWLGTHFSACDANHDGKLTQQEYTQCTQHAGAATPEGVPSSASSVH